MLKEEYEIKTDFRIFKSDLNKKYYDRANLKAIINGQTKDKKKFEDILLEQVHENLKISEIDESKKTIVEKEIAIKQTITRKNWADKKNDKTREEIYKELEYLKESCQHAMNIVNM